MEIDNNVNVVVNSRNETLKECSPQVIDNQPNTIKLFWKLKSEIELFSKQFNRQKMTLRLVGSFLKSNKLISSGGNVSMDDINVDRTKFEDFNRNYHFWDKKLRRYNRKKKLLALNDILTELYRELSLPLSIAANDQSKVSNDNVSLDAGKPIDVQISNQSLNDTEIRPINVEDSDDDIIDITPAKSNIIISKPAVPIVKQQTNQEPTNQKVKLEVKSSRKACSFAGCKLKFSSKKALLNHLFEHSIKPNHFPKRKQKNTSKKGTVSTRATKSRRKRDVFDTEVDVDAPRQKRQRKKQNYIELAGEEGGEFIGENLEKDLRRKSQLMEDEDSEYDPNETDLCDDEKRRFRCNFKGCQYAFPALAALRNHERSHSDLKEFKCHICSARFKYKPNLSTHVKLHEGIRYRCTYQDCSSSYTNQRLLNRHVKVVHTKEARTFPCDWEGCSYVASSNDRLLKHRPVHTKERNFHCPWPDCDKSFGQYGTMRAHMLIHKNERKYRCTLVPGCNFDCNTNSNLRKHLLAHERKNELSEPLDVLVKRMRSSRNGQRRAVVDPDSHPIHEMLSNNINQHLHNNDEIDQQVTYLNSFLN